MVPGVYVSTLQGVCSGVMMMRMPAGGGGQPGPSAALDTAPGTRYRYTTVYTLSVATSGEADHIVIKIFCTCSRNQVTM